jgi:hypothetical protein
MLVQLNRTDGHRAPTPTATDLPLAGLAPREPDPVVALFGHPGRVAGLAAQLPAGWRIRRSRDLDDVGPGDIVLFARASVREVATARSVLRRRTRIVALVDEDAPAELVAELLTAGADACVPGGQPAILAGHLVACRRRQLTDRWRTLEAVPPHV